MKKSRKIIPLLSMVVLTIALSSCGGSSAGSIKGSSTDSTIGKVEKATCQSSAMKELGAECKYITLKADYDDSKDSRTIKSYYSVIKAEDKSSNKEPIVYLVGGPGGSGTFSVDEMLSFDTNMKKLLKSRDLIVVDYRGTGFSKPFAECKIDNSTPKSLKSSLLECRASYEKLGIKPTDYKSRYIAKDIDEILKAQKIDKAILYGTSYGTRVASTVAREYPDRVAGMILDGFFPIEVNGISQASESVLEKLRALGEKYPKLNIDDLLEDLASKDKNTLLNIVATVYDAIPGFSQMTQMSVEELSHTPKEAIYSFLITDVIPKLTYIDGAEGLLGALRDINIVSYNDAPSKSIRSIKGDGEDDLRNSSDLMAYSIILSEEYLYTKEQQPHLFGFSGSVIDALEGYQGGSPMPISDLDTIESYLKVPKAKKMEIEPLKSDIPVIIFSGGFDMQTPLFWSKNAKKYLSDAHLFFFEQEDHVLSVTNPDAFGLIKKFINNLDNTKVLDGLQSEDFKEIK